MIPDEQRNGLIRDKSRKKEYKEKTSFWIFGYFQKTLTLKPSPIIACDSLFMDVSDGDLRKKVRCLGLNSYTRQV